MAVARPGIGQRCADWIGEHDGDPVGAFHQHTHGAIDKNFGLEGVEARSRREGFQDGLGCEEFGRDGVGDRPRQLDADPFRLGALPGLQGVQTDAGHERERNNTRRGECEKTTAERMISGHGKHTGSRTGSAASRQTRRLRRGKEGATGGVGA
jgi:hypothetical protein